ncbi:hypothetical protein C8J57DRAFT_1320581 [Mycena rebaudengoi]|nr:hypothetical protein C8J57DRAFT_1320581 [Mycena rebaudengoi]
MSVPPDAELQDALAQLKAQNPALGIAKIHARLREEHPDWVVSEKRTRKVLLLVASESAPSAPNPSALNPHPTSALVPGLDVGAWTPRVAVRLFNAQKGKGLVASQKIKAGETVWTEDPFVIAPEWEIYDKMRAGAACAFCTTLFPLARTRVRCPHCPAAFCSAACRTRAGETTHALLCPAQNPASMPLLRWARAREWMALHALVQCTARVLRAYAAGEAQGEKDWGVAAAFAELGMEERAKYSFKSEPDRETWRTAFEMYCHAFHRPRRDDGAPAPKLPDEEKRVAAILRMPLPAHVEAALFDYDTGFLRGLGRMSLNLEAHGGLYTLHAHLNHSCAPNVSVRHLDQRTALARITLRATADIAVGQELLITYVDPQAGYAERRGALAGWGFVCACARCAEEGRGYAEPEGIPADLASELKAGLGVM